MEEKLEWSEEGCSTTETEDEFSYTGSERTVSKITGGVTHITNTTVGFLDHRGSEIKHPGIRLTFSDGRNSRTVDFPRRLPGKDREAILDQRASYEKVEEVEWDEERGLSYHCRTTQNYSLCVLGGPKEGMRRTAKVFFK